MSAEARPEVHPATVLYQLSTGHYQARALGLVAKLGIADLLGDERRSAQELAAATNTHAGALRRVLRLLASVGVFEEHEDGRFSLTPVGQALRDDVPGSMRAMVLLYSGEAVQNRWAELEYCVRTGQPAFKQHAPDADVFAIFAKDPEAAANFDKAMASLVPQTVAAVTQAYDFSAFSTLVDVGGGNGALLSGILSAIPALSGVLFDQPHVVERARPGLEASSVGPRLTLVGGNFFESVPEGKDAYLLKHIIHDWTDAEASAILRVCRKAMPAHAKLLIVEGVYPERVTVSPAAQDAAANDVNMLVNTGGRQRSEREFRALLSESGFELARIVPTPGHVSVIEARPR
jgi:hypothetical protein